MTARDAEPYSSVGAGGAMDTRAALFETRVGDNHHHLVCRDCGRTVDVDCAVGETPCLEPSAAAGFEIDEAEVIFWGRCPDCVKQSELRRSA